MSTLILTAIEHEDEYYRIVDGYKCVINTLLYYQISLWLMA